MNLLLSQDERNRFADWCEMEASSNDGIIQQMEKMNIHQNIIKSRKSEVVAYLIVAGILRRIEDA